MIENIFRPAAIFSDDMILQRNGNAAVFGTAPDGLVVTVEFNGEQSTAVAANGRWHTAVSVPAEKGSYTMVIRGGNETYQINNILAGEVWIAGGQSNMGLQMYLTNNLDTYQVDAANSDLRYFNVPLKSFATQNTQTPCWQLAAPDTIAGWSAVGYLFGRFLQQALGCPVAIVSCCMGGTPADAWVNRETLLADDYFRPIVELYEAFEATLNAELYEQEWQESMIKREAYNKQLKTNPDAVHPGPPPFGPKAHSRPHALYDYMLTTITPYKAAGVIWYQGEGNAYRADQYRTLFPALIELWRKDFANINLPFLFVQLPGYYNFNDNNTAWAELRDAQFHTLRTVNNTAMAVAIDQGEKNEIHPKNKAVIANRLTLLALTQVYGQKNIESNGPLFEKADFRGSSVKLHFSHTGAGLVFNGQGVGFSVCSENQDFVPAQAFIEQDTVVVNSDRIIKDVRYAWQNWPNFSLYNKAGLPASPFRTDNFPLLTKGKVWLSPGES